MIAKYAGNCSKCGERIEKGENCGYENKKIFHYECATSPEDPGLLADRLGYHRFNWDELQSGPMGNGGSVLVLPGADRDKDGGDDHPGSAAHGDGNPLRPVSAGKEGG